MNRALSQAIVRVWTDLESVQHYIYTGLCVPPASLTLSDRITRILQFYRLADKVDLQRSLNLVAADLKTCIADGPLIDVIMKGERLGDMRK